jgi:hypothetical protein
VLNGLVRQWAPRAGGGTVLKPMLAAHSRTPEVHPARFIVWESSED